MNSESMQRQVNAITAGVTRPKVTLADFRKLQLATPTMLEQKAIADWIAEVDAHIATDGQRMDKLQATKRGPMHDLLTGHVTVPITESPEPAEASSTG